MNLELTDGKLCDARAQRIVFGICWIAYFTAYLGRTNYSACIAEIYISQGWVKSEAGIIATGFFVSYGFGQSVNGIIGDKISPEIMISSGLCLSGIINILFPFTRSVYTSAVLWCVNGFVQSMIWSPLIRLLCEIMPEEKRFKICINMSSAVPIGTMAAYGLSAALVSFSNWRTVFRVSGIFVIIIGGVWLGIVGPIGKHHDFQRANEGERLKKENAEGSRLRFGKLLLISAIPMCCSILLMQGILKDGITTWIPVFLSERFGLLAANSIFSTAIIPVINLGGVYLASWLNRRIISNELLCASVFFLAAGLSVMVLIVYECSAVGSMLMLAAVTTAMMGVNTLLVGVLPSYFVKFGRCSTVSGILNTSVYLGCALSAYLNGVVVDYFGWNITMIMWTVFSIVGYTTCLLAKCRWEKFKTNYSINID